MATKLAKATASKQPAILTPTDHASRTEYLLDVAAQTFLQQGFEGTSVGEIARRAHASKETLYSKFTNKNELFRAVMRRLMDRFADRLSSALVTQDTPEKTLTAIGGLMLERVLSDEGIGLQKIVFMEARRFPEVARIFFELGPQRTMGALVAYFNAQVEKGNLREMDSELAAAHFMGLLTAEMMMRKSLGLFVTPTAEEKARRIDGAVQVFLRAYGPVKPSTKSRP